ncbi:hypothetical protein HXX76_001012 [Chlamydomonas incerta]|uniref:Uncharacterized protein n=1 Tax=Chlamydomonas incerta TaxID=51695 RepID=A0A835WBH4_CHLIN|nr:hypothetical protein HXX76_001012 [Chlamydomonas incerta]|eukprot:KAG2444255.1 hypothetical protein HXX76_001012 [Chlamydomonas incerta]
MRRSYAAALAAEPAGPGADAAVVQNAGASSGGATAPAAAPQVAAASERGGPAGPAGGATARLQVLGVGFGRTGTLPLYVALNALGYRTHHMAELPLHMRLLLRLVAPPLARLRRMMEMVEELVWGPRGTFRGRFGDKEFVFDAHYAEVRLVPRERLLEYDVRQGWAPLCAFVGRPPPLAGAGGAGGGGAAAIKPPTIKLPGWGEQKEVKGAAAAAAAEESDSPASSPASSSGSATDAGGRAAQQRPPSGAAADGRVAAELAADVAAAPLPFPHVNDTAEFRERMEAVARLVRSIKAVQRGVEAAACVGLAALLARASAALLAARPRRA